MGTLNTLYVQTNDPDQVSAVKQKYPNAQWAPGSEFIEISLPIADLSYPTEEWEELSRLIQARVFHLLFQSTVDAFRFQYFDSGSSVRVLQYGCEEQGVWEKVQGQREPWEITAFFIDSTQLEGMDNDPDWKVIERIWKEQQLEPGRFFPLVAAREAARTAAEYYRFPGWE